MPEIRNFKGSIFRTKMNLKGVYFWSEENILGLESCDDCITLLKSTELYTSR